jgi:3-hydroxyacyl-[acyl-carrier-protein] dehydratase
VKFVLIDRIVELESGRRIVAQKAVSLAEEYLADHFPRFPVLPGVLMVEALVQSAAWLVREALDFGPSLVLLKEARNVTYKSFVPPGQVLTLEADCLSLEPGQSQFAARGHVSGREIVKGRLTLRHLDLPALDIAYAATAARLREDARSLFGLLWRGGAAAAVGAPPGGHACKD